MIDASIYSLQKPLPAPPNPLEVAGKAMALQNMRQEQQLNAERLKQEQQQTAATDRALAEDQIIREHQRQFGNDTDGMLGALRGKISPERHQKLQKGIYETQEAFDKLDKGKREKIDWSLGHITNGIDAVTSLPEQEQAPAYAAQIQRWNSLGIDTSKLPQQYPGADALKMEGDQAKLLKSFSDRAKLKQDQQTADDLHAQRQAELPKIQAEAAAKQREQDAVALSGALRQGADKYYEVLHSLTPERRAVFEGVYNPDRVLQLGQSANEQVQTGLTRERNQQIAENERRMRDIAEGTLRVAQEHANIARQIFDQTYGPGSNPALQGVEPRLRTPASREAQTAANEFTKAMESTAAVQTFIDLTRKGNKAAGSNLPLMGAESIQALNGIRRINRSEIAQYEGAGSLLDRIQGRVGKLVAGQPIPKDVLDDIEKLHQAIAGNATKTYNERLKSLNQNYHANFQPVGQEKQSDGAAHVNTKEEYDRLPSGATYIDAQDGKTYVKR